MHEGRRVPASVGIWACLLALPCGASGDANADIEEARRAATQSVAMMQAGGYDKAAALLRQGFQASARLGPDNPWTGLLWHNQGSYHQDRRECDAGKKAYYRALRTWERTGHSMLVLTAVSLGSFHLECGEPKQAERIWKKYLEKRVSGLKETDLRVARALAFRGGILMAKKKYAGAESLLLRSLEIWERQFGPDEVRTVSLWNSLAVLRTRMRRYEEALRDERRAVAVVEHAYGPSHPLLPKLYANMSAIYDAAGRGVEAEETCRKALELAAGAFGRESPVTAEVLLAHASLLRKLDRKGEAEQARREAQAITASAWRGSTVDAGELAR